MKWFFCWCQETEFRTDHDWPDMIRVAVESALQNTNLEPHFIYDGQPSPLTEELSKNGVTVHFHKLSFEQAIIDYKPDDWVYQSIARAAFLRFDIPLFAKDDEFVLYTDVDVVFLKDLDFSEYRPNIFGAAPQMSQGQKWDMNSGVLLLRLSAMHRDREALSSFAINNLHIGLDQEILRAFYGKNYLLLPDIFNWKPYWGKNDDAAILHWHGPKPVLIEKWIENRELKVHGPWQELLERPAADYEGFVGYYKVFLEAWYTRSGSLMWVARKFGLPWPLPPIGAEVIEP